MIGGTNVVIRVAVKVLQKVSTNKPSGSAQKYFLTHYCSPDISECYLSDDRAAVGKTSTSSWLGKFGVL